MPGMVLIRAYLEKISDIVFDPIKFGLPPISLTYIEKISLHIGDGRVLNLNQTNIKKEQYDFNYVLVNLLFMMELHYFLILLLSLEKLK